MKNERTVYQYDADFVQSETVLECSRINNIHTLKKSNSLAKMFKPCSVCGIRKKFPWTIFVKCRGCKLICHQRCLVSIDPMTCPVQLIACSCCSPDDDSWLGSAAVPSPSYDVHQKNTRDLEGVNGMLVNSGGVAEEPVVVHDYSENAKDDVGVRNVVVKTSKVTTVCVHRFHHLGVHDVHLVYSIANIFMSLSNGLYTTVFNHSPAHDHVNSATAKVADIIRRRQLYPSESRQTGCTYTEFLRPWAFEHYSTIIFWTAALPGYRFVGLPEFIYSPYMEPMQNSIETDASNAEEYQYPS